MPGLEECWFHGMRLAALSAKGAAGFVRMRTAIGPLLDDGQLRARVLETVRR
jgi:hypothetical protein